jgi:hypothetical protein
MRVSHDDDDGDNNSRLVRSADWVWQDGIIHSKAPHSTRRDPSGYDSQVLRQILPSSEMSQKYL